MKIHLLLLLLLSQFFTICAQTTPQKFVKPRPKIDILMQTMAHPEGYVTDFENLFSDSETQQIDSLIVDFEKRTTMQIAVVTLYDFHCDKKDFDDYTLQLANAWSVGQKEKDNGVLIGISKQFRQMRIQNGFGIEKILSDAATKEIVDNYFIPPFKEGNYFEGTFNGLKALMQTLENKQLLQTKAEAFTTELIALIKQKDITTLAQHIAENLYCGICTESADSPNQISKALFLKKYILEIFDNELIPRLQRKETKFFANTTDYGDFIILYTTYRNNEFGDGHEGAQFGFWLKEENGRLKLSGLESIP